MATSADKGDKGDKSEAGDTHAERDDRAESAKADAEAKIGAAVDEEPAEGEAAADADAAGDAPDGAADGDEEAPPKPAAKAKPAGAKRAGAAAGKGKARPGAAKPQQGSSLGKSMILFVVIIGGLAAGFAILGRDEQLGPAKPKWKAGEVADVELTLVKNDKVELACAAPDEIGGKHCGFESSAKPWSKGDAADDKKLLRPYTTTDRMQFLASGVWSEAALAPDKMPASRFSLKCKYKVDGMLKNVAVRWEQTGQWFPNNEWYAGAVSDCKVVP